MNLKNRQQLLTVVALAAIALWSAPHMLSLIVPVHV